MVDRLSSDYSYLGLSLDVICAVIAAHPNLSEAQLRNVLDRYSDLINNCPNLVKKYGAVAVFQEFIALSAYDPTHGGNYMSRKPSVERELGKGMEEAIAELGVMEIGKVLWPLKPSTNPYYEAIDPNGQTWDVKSPRSVTPNGRVFNADKVIRKMQRDFDEGENIILDNRYITLEEIQELYKRLRASGQDGRVVWWPINPTDYIFVAYKRGSF